MGSTYIWQYSSRSLLYVVFGTLALGISEWLHAEGLKISVDVFFFSTSANQIAYLSKASSEALQTCSQTCLSRGFFVGLQTTVACFLSFFFFFFARLTANLKLYVCEKVYDLSVALHLKNEFERSGWNPFGLAWLRAGILSAPC